MRFPLEVPEDERTKSDFYFEEPRKRKLKPKEKKLKRRKRKSEIYQANT